MTRQIPFSDSYYWSNWAFTTKIGLSIATAIGFHCDELLGVGTQGFLQHPCCASRGIVRPPVPGVEVRLIDKDGSEITVGWDTLKSVAVRSVMLWSII